MRAIVIGAGPAGLTFAYNACIRGIKIKVYEARKYLAYKPCGEAFSLEALKAIPNSHKLGSKWILNRIDHVDIYFNSEYVKTIPSPFDEKGFIINKRLFLEKIAELAIDEGAQIEMGKIFNGEEDADLIIDASGYFTYSRRNFKDLYKNYKTIPVLRDYAVSNGIIDENHLIIDFLDRGYFWIFPYGKDLYNIGIGGFYSTDELRKIYEKEISKFSLKLIDKSRMGAGLSVGGLIQRQSIGKYYIIGESAGFVMPCSGEGIRYAMFSAYEFFSKSKKIKEMKSRISMNALLLKLLLSIPRKFKKTLLESSTYETLTLFLGERKLNARDLYYFLNLPLKNPKLLNCVSRIMLKFLHE